MNKRSALVLVGLLLVVVLFAAGALYRHLSDAYDNASLVGTTEDTATSSEETTEPFYNPAPDFTVLDRDGNEVTLADFRSKPVVINFWATWCGYCKEEMPAFRQAYEAHPDVQFLMINATDGYRETIESATAYIEQEGFPFDVFFDTAQSAVTAYRITGFPATYFIDKDGNLVTYAAGLLDAEALERGIALIDK